MTGISGSGKSTAAKKYMTGDHVYLNGDSVRKELYGDENIQGDGAKVFGIIKSRYDKALKDGIETIVVDNTSLNPKTRKEYIEKAIPAGYEVTIVYLKIPLKVAMDRNSKRDRKVPDEVIQNQFAKLTPPSPEERKICKVVEVTS
jgi:predicted kinase